MPLLPPSRPLARGSIESLGTRSPFNRLAFVNGGTSTRGAIAIASRACGGARKRSGESARGAARISPPFPSTSPRSPPRPPSGGSPSASDVGRTARRSRVDRRDARATLQSPARRRSSIGRYRAHSRAHARLTHARTHACTPAIAVLRARSLVRPLVVPVRPLVRAYARSLGAPARGQE